MFAFDNTWFRALEGTYTPWQPRAPKAPSLLWFNDELAGELGVADLRPDAARVLSGAVVPDGAQPLAQAYAGHQFGGLSPQLGDGRALLLGEVVDRHGRRRDVQLKGSGRTPFSRGGDGLAAVGPMLREAVMGEAMHALGIPTTRALAVVATGEPVVRERPLPGAVLTRIAASHLRVGTFEFFAIRGETDTLRRLVDYALARHYPDAAGDIPALTLFAAVRDAQAALVAQWMGVGFIHGVLNTDNVTIAGETIDYGPCAFMDAHDPATVFSSIDHGGRYAYGNQPPVTAWNLGRLGGALLHAIDDDLDRAVAQAQAVLDGWEPAYAAAWDQVLRRKLGLSGVRDGDDALLRDLEGLLVEHRPDHTGFFRALSDAARGRPDAVLATVDGAEPVRAWLDRWRARLGPDAAATADALDRVNPRVVPRNHRVEDALTAAVDGDLRPFEALLDAVRDPFTDDPAAAPYTTPAPAAFTERYQTFCGT